MMSPQSLFSLIDFLGVAAAAIGGALEARKDKIHKYDFVGVVGLGLVSALGGGIVRDVLIAHGAPLALTDLRYLIVAFSGCFLGLLLGWRLHAPTQSLIIPIDAAALGLFAISGATRAINTGLSYLPALLLGVVTSVGGGALRDVLSGRTPKIFESGQLYAVVAFFAAVVFLGLEYAGVPSITSTCIGVGAGSVLRLLSVRLGWKTPAVASLQD
jgi:uncharacterized membrane protein YeiH